MPERYILDKALKTGTLYRTEDDKYLVVEAVGTNSTTKGKLTVDGAIVLETIDDLARLQPRDIERFPPMDLKALRVIIPPEKPFMFEGSSGSFLRMVGALMILAPGETVPSADLARFTEQPRKYYTYDTGTGGIGASATWAKDDEYTVIDTTCAAGERWTFDRFAYVRRTGVIADDTVGAIALRFYLDDRPLELIDPARAPLGIDTLRGHYYADTTSYYIPFNLERMPIVLEEGRNRQVKARNISGADITTAAAEEAKVEIHLVKQRELV